jgi:hypothetical protein
MPLRWPPALQLDRQGITRHRRGPSVSSERQDPPIKYCRVHHMVYSLRLRKWITVPDDFLAELRQADFPVELVERHCPQCYKQISTHLKPM